MPQLTKAKILLAQDTTETLQQAEELLSRAHDFFVNIHSTRYLIDVLSLQALVEDARGKESNSFENLTKALNLAEPGGFIRPFVDLGPKMADLLKRLAQQNRNLKYIGQVLKDFRTEGHEVVQEKPDDQTVSILSSSRLPFGETLSNRESEVLLLLAQRMSNKEIAENLFVSPQTVKSHLYNIFQKLNVKNRRQAVEEAVALGIISDK